MNMEFRRKLPIPKEIKAMYPISPEFERLREQKDKEVKDILSGQDDRLLLLVGPCSADNETAVLDYLTRLRKTADEVAERVLIVPRVYTSKPRTTGIGYKGMLHQPDPEGNEDMLKGIIAIRETYIRAVENQGHRLTASGLDVAVGMKNPTSGDFSVMMNSITAAQSSHMFIYRNWEVVSKGNPYAHAILRGYMNKKGQSLPNYHYEDLKLVCDMYHKAELQNPAIIVDVNHANSGKKYLEQIRISKEVLQSRTFSEDVHDMVKGLMIESYLEDGNQPVNGTVYGQSITDPCLGWDKTERLIRELAEMV